MCSDNYVGAIGAAILGNALQRNSSLRELSLKGNELVNEGTLALCKAFEERQGAISFLDLGNNRSRHSAWIALMHSQRLLHSLNPTSMAQSRNHFLSQKGYCVCLLYERPSSVYQALD